MSHITVITRFSVVSLITFRSLLFLFIALPFVKHPFITTGMMNPNFHSTDVYYLPNDQFHQMQSEINDVTDIMRQNIRLGIERGANLDDLEIKAEDLNNYSQQFAYGAHEVHNKYWWKNVKMWILIIIIVVIILTLIIVLSVLAAKNKI
ncbi:unnamed protein product [Rotaria socialis]|uniref:V-SNARE coiled-coil homology domain-containing protein n=1 Tax=Rotaria socialis TaxID=392032 RepID=A0A818LMS5_9BILA|nr:unnamed protein product [Rotaria socialis]